MLSVKGNVNTDPIGRIEHFGEVLRVSYFPPSYAGFIRVVNACHVAAWERVATVLFLEVGALPHAAVAYAAHTFGYAIVFRVKALFDDLPFMVLQVLFHFLLLSVLPAAALA